MEIMMRAFLLFFFHHFGEAMAHVLHLRSLGFQKVPGESGPLR